MIWPPPVQLVSPGRRGPLGQVLKVVSDPRDRKVERRAQPLYLPAGINERPRRSRWYQDMDLSTDVVGTQTKGCARGELLLPRQVQRLWPKSLVGVLTDDQLERIDEVVADGVPCGDLMPFVRFPIKTERPTRVPNALNRIRIQKPYVYFRAVRLFGRIKVQPALDQGTKLGVLCQGSPFGRQGHPDISVDESGFASFFAGPDERQFVGSQRTTETKPVLVPSGRQDRTHLKKRPGVEDVVVMGFVDLAVIGAPPVSPNDLRVPTDSAELHRVVSADGREFRTRIDLRSLATQSLVQRLVVDQVDLYVLVPTCAGLLLLFGFPDRFRSDADLDGFGPRNHDFTYRCNDPVQDERTNGIGTVRQIVKEVVPWSRRRNLPDDLARPVDDDDNHVVDSFPDVNGEPRQKREQRKENSTHRP